MYDKGPTPVGLIVIGSFILWIILAFVDMFAGTELAPLIMGSIILLALAYGMIKIAIAGYHGDREWVYGRGYQKKSFLRAAAAACIYILVIVVIVNVFN